MNNGKDSLYTKPRGGLAHFASQKPRDVDRAQSGSGAQYNNDRGPRQDEARLSDPLDQVGQAMIEGRFAAACIGCTPAAIVLRKPQVRL